MLRYSLLGRRTMHCKFCGAVLPEPAAGVIVRRKQEYCNQAHRQADYRRRQAEPRQEVQAHVDPGLFQELVQARTQRESLQRELEQAKVRIKQLEQTSIKPRRETKTAMQYRTQVHELERENAVLEFRLASSINSKLKRYDFRGYLNRIKPTALTLRLQEFLPD